MLVKTQNAHILQPSNSTSRYIIEVTAFVTAKIWKQTTCSKIIEWISKYGFYSVTLFYNLYKV